MLINQDVSLYSTVLEVGREVSHRFDQSRHGWLQLISGKIDVNGVTIETGDGLAISDEKDINITGIEESEFILFDLK